MSKTHADGLKFFEVWKLIMCPQSVPAYDVIVLEAIPETESDQVRQRFGVSVRKARRI